MTPAEQTAIGMALYGHRWQTRLSRALGVNSRTVRHWVKGDAPISRRIAAEIGRLLGAAEAEKSEWPRDAFVVGDGPPLDGGNRREYVIHLRPPRFVARVVATDDDGLPEPGEEPADLLSGVVYSCDSYVLCEIFWIDDVPPAGELHRLMEAACDRIDGDGDAA